MGSLIVLKVCRYRNIMLEIQICGDLVTENSLPVHGKEDSRRLMSGLFAVITTIGLLFILFYKYDPWEVFSIIRRSATPNVFLCSALLVTSHIFIISERFRQVLSGMNIRISLAEAIRIRMGCSPAKFVLPFKAGEIFKPLYLLRVHDVPFVTGTSAVIFDKFAVLIVMIPFFLLAAILSGKIIFISFAAVVCVGVGSLFIPLVRSLIMSLAGLFGNKIGGIISKLLSSFEMISFGKSLYVVGLCFIVYTIEILMFFVVFRAAGVSSGVSDIFTAVVYAQVVGILPFFISGIGGREAALVLLLGNGTNESAVLAGSILFSIFGRVVIHLAGIIWMPSFLRGVFTKKSSAPASSNHPS